MGFDYHHDFTGSGNFLPPGGPYPPPSGMDMTSLENMANYHPDGPHCPPGAESPNSSCSGGNGGGGGGGNGNPLHAFPSPPPQTQDFSSNDFPPSGENSSSNGGNGCPLNPGVENNFTNNPTGSGQQATEQCYPSPPLSLEYSTSPAQTVNAAAKSSTTTAVSSTANSLPPLPQAAMV